MAPLKGYGLPVTARINGTQIEITVGSVVTLLTSLNTCVTHNLHGGDEGREVVNSGYKLFCLLIEYSLSYSQGTLKEKDC